MKPDLSEITFVIPFYLDSKERDENLSCIVNFLQKNFSTNVLLVESLNKPKTEAPEILKNLLGNIEYEPHEPIYSSPEIFYRTETINFGIKKCKTPYACIYDTDVIFEPANFVRSLELLKQGNTLVYPYGGKFVDIERSYLTDGIIKERESYVTESFGGAVFVNIEKYKQCGLENQNIIGWGFEDFERIDRIKILGHTWARVPGTCWHIEHPRGINSSTQNPHWANNEKELYKVRAMHKEELTNYINQWQWTQKNLKD